MSGFIVRTVGQTDYGVYQTMSAFAGYLILLEFGTGTVMSRNISLCKKGDKDRTELQKNVSTIWSFTILLSIIITFCSVIFYLSIDNIYNDSLTHPQIVFGKQLFVFVIINLIFTFLTHTLNGVVLGHEYYAFEKLLSSLKLLTRTLLLILLLTLKPNVFMIVLVDAVMSFLVFLTTFLFCALKIRILPEFRHFSLPIFKSILPLCLTMLLQTITTTVNGNVDKFLIGILLNPESVTIYAISMGLYTMFSSVATLPVTMYMPKIAASIRDGLSREKLQDFLVLPCRLNMLVTGVLAFGIVTVGQQFIQIIYGATYKEAWLYAVLVIIPMFFNMSNAVIINVVDVLRKRHFKVFISITTAIINLIMTFFGIKYWGLFGAALATGIATLLDTFFVNLFYVKVIKINVVRLFLESAKGILSYLLIATAVSFPVRYILDSVYLQFFVGGIVFCVVFALLFILFGSNESEKKKIETFKAKIMCHIYR